MVKFRNIETGRAETCIGLWTNPVKNPRKVYSLPETTNHEVFDIEPAILEPSGLSYDKYKKLWLTFKVLHPWEIMIEKPWH